MEYVSYEYFIILYGRNSIDEGTFSRLRWEAERELDKATTGIDGVCKLRVAFPENGYEVEAIKRCECSLINYLANIENALNHACDVMNGQVISSKSAGNESVTYASNSADNAISNALKGVQEKSMEMYKIISNSLSGICDANGINLLYAGRYPYNV